MMPVGLSVVCAAAQALHSLLHVMWIQHAARLVASQMATCPQRDVACMASACEPICSLGRGQLLWCAPVTGNTAKHHEIQAFQSQSCGKQ